MTDTILLRLILINNETENWLSVGRINLISFFLAGKMVLSCRFYKEKYPEVEDVVMVNVRSIAEMGAYVHLLEYNNIEGMILLSELSRRRIRSINKLIRVGKTEPVVVIRVDKEKGNVYGSSLPEVRSKEFYIRCFFYTVH